MRRFIRTAALALGLIAAAARAQSPPPEEAENVNKRYTVARVEFPEQYREDLSSDLRAQIDALAGKKYDDEAVRKAAKEAESELKRKVTPRVNKGAEPDTLVVTFEVERRRFFPQINTRRTELLAYHSRLGWSGGIEADILDGPTSLSLGFKNNGERKLEREAGLIGSFGRRIVSDRLAFRFEWENLRAQWNPTTLTALESRSDLPSIYRRHDIFAPSLAVRVAPALTLQGGVEFNRLQFQYPQRRIEWANAIFGELKADHRWETGSIRHRIEAGYRATATTDGLESDISYTQHRGGAMYRLRAGDEEFRVRFNAGAVNGRAPFYARFNLGNLDTLRGWSQYDVAPLGGNRMAHGSLEYRHDWFWTWYDTGAVYDRGSPSKVRHSLGLGIRSGREFEFGVGFPIRSGSINPVFFVRVGW